MNVTQENRDELNITLSVNIGPEDYEKEVEKKLHDYRKKVTLNGFRPGKVPFGLVKKMYGKSILAEEVNRIFGEAISGYISENKLQILGEPLPAEESQQIDFDTQHEFNLNVDVALAPTFDVELSAKIKVPYYTIKIDDKLVNEYITGYRQQLGELKDVETVTDTAYLKGKLTEATPEGSPLPEGISVEDASLSLATIKDEKIKKAFIGKKTGDTVVFEIRKAFPNDTDLAALLQTDKEKLEALNPHFIYEISEIKKFAEAEENQDFYDKLFGKDEVKDHEAFTDKIKETIRRNLDMESEQRFGKDAIDKLTETFKPQLPETFLKRWLNETNEGKFTPEQIDDEFEAFLDNLQWDLIREKIAVSQKIEPTPEEILEQAKNYTHAQFHQYGLGHLPDEQLEQFAREQMEKEENYRRFANAVLDRKVIDHVKTVVKIVDKNVTREAFNKLYEEEQKKDK